MNAKSPNNEQRQQPVIAVTYGVRQIANWILDYADSQNVKLTNMALNKLIYFAYEYALVQYNRRLTNAKIEAWDHGPVFREVYRSFKNNGSKPIADRATVYDPLTDSLTVATACIDQNDQEIIIEAINDLIKLPAFVLREISHSDDGAWSSVWNHSGRTNPGMEISDEIIYRTNESRRLS